MSESNSTNSSSKPPARSAINCRVPEIEICDVGARSEGDDRYSGLIEQGLAQVTGFEPDPAELARLQGQNPRRRYLSQFIGNGGPATFYHASYGGCSSLYQPDPSVIDLFTSIGATHRTDNFTTIRTEEVQTTRLDDVPGLLPCDYLKVDVQGAELDVLSGAPRALSTAVVLELEVSFIPLYKNQPLFGDVQTFLRGRGFFFHKLIDVCGRAFRPSEFPGNRYCPMSQMLWADSIFVRNFADLKSWSTDQLLKAAVILYEVYDSIDLVRYLLDTYDRRSGTQLAQHFIRALASMPAMNLQLLNIKAVP